MSYYISCPSCQIGGYDFCPMCCGSGGFLSKLEPPNVIIPHNTEIEEKIEFRIDKFGSLVLSEFQKSHLNQIYDYLKLIISNEVTTDLIKRIETIRTKQFRTALNMLVKNKF